MVYKNAKFEIEDKLIKAYDIFAIQIFGSMEHFRKIDASIPRWVAEAKLSSDCKVGKDMFQQLYEGSSEHETLNRILYYYDCENLIGSFQNVVNESFYLSDRIDRILAEKVRYSAADNALFSDYTGYQFLSGQEEVVELFSLTNMLFINLYSQLDYITKLFFEMKNICESFDAYPKMRSCSILYGQKGKLNISSIENTIFDNDSAAIKTVINFRSEIVHNGTLDSMQRLFQKYENGKIVEQFILLPDTTEGNLDKYKGRKHFYGRENKWNDIVPALLEDFYLRLKYTLDLILSSQTRNG